MAAVVLRLHVAALLVFFLAAKAAASSVPGTIGPGRYCRVFGFGNSLTDTGNSDIYPLTAGGMSSRPPYGETYFGHPSGRASDGRILIDFLVEALKVPQPLPYLAGSTAADFRNGVNFAIGGSTALEPEFLRSKGLMVFVPVSLSNETTWFKRVVQQLSSSVVHEQRKMMAESFFFVGEMGINDYFAALLSNRSVDETARLVPHVVAAIRRAVTATVAAGARTVMVTGMPPLGCAPYMLSLFPGRPGDYDPASGCNTRLNGLAELHNRALKAALRKLTVTYDHRSRRPSFVYADVYRPIVDAVTSPAKYGFGAAPLAACCGGAGGKYNFNNFTKFCGQPGSAACADPSKSVSWDGIHFTEAANRFIARTVLPSSE